MPKKTGTRFEIALDIDLEHLYQMVAQIHQQTVPASKVPLEEISSDIPAQDAHTTSQEVVSLKAEIKNLMLDKEKQSTKYTELQGETQRLRQHCSTLQEKLSSLNEKQSLWDKFRSKAKKDKTTLESDLNECQRKLQEHKDLLTQCNHDGRQKDKSIKTLREELTTKGTQLKNLETKLNIKENTLTSLIEDQKILTEKQKTLEIHNQSSTQEIAELHKDIQKEKIENDMLKQNQWPENILWFERWLCAQSDFEFLSRASSTSNEHRFTILTKLGRWDNMQTFWERLAKRCRCKSSTPGRSASADEKRALEMALELFNCAQNDRKASLIETLSGERIDSNKHESITQTKRGLVQSCALPGLRAISGKIFCALVVPQ